MRLRPTLYGSGWLFWLSLAVCAAWVGLLWVVEGCPTAAVHLLLCCFLFGLGAACGRIKLGD